MGAVNNSSSATYRNYKLKYKESVFEEYIKDGENKTYTSMVNVLPTKFGKKKVTYSGGSFILWYMELKDLDSPNESEVVVVEFANFGRRVLSILSPFWGLETIEPVNLNVYTNKTGHFSFALRLTKDQNELGNAAKPVYGVHYEKGTQVWSHIDDHSKVIPSIVYSERRKDGEVVKESDDEDLKIYITEYMKTWCDSALGIPFEMIGFEDNSSTVEQTTSEDIVYKIVKGLKKNCGSFESIQTIYPKAVDKYKNDLEGLYEKLEQKVIEICSLRFQKIVKIENGTIIFVEEVDDLPF